MARGYAEGMSREYMTYHGCRHEKLAVSGQALASTRLLHALDRSLQMESIGTVDISSRLSRAEIPVRPDFDIPLCCYIIHHHQATSSLFLG